MSKLAAYLADREHFERVGEAQVEPSLGGYLTTNWEVTERTFERYPVYRLNLTIRSQAIIKGDIWEAHKNSRAAVLRHILADVREAIETLLAEVASGRMSQDRVGQELLRLSEYLFDETATKYRVLKGQDCA